MMEEYVNGAEISVEVLRWNNKSVPLVSVYKGETTLIGTHPLKTRCAPVNIEYLTTRISRMYAKKIIDRLDTNGTAEVEFIYDPEKRIKHLEINTRP